MDDEAVGAVIADVARSDLSDAFLKLGEIALRLDSCHGFVTDLGALALRGSLSIRVANTDHVLSGALPIDTLKAPPAVALNQVFGDGGLRLHGWAIDPVDRRRVVGVRAFLEHRCLAQARAERELPVLRSRQVGARGFELDLPPDLADGRVHQVRVVDENGIALNGSPVSICCHAQGGRQLLTMAEARDGLLGALVDGYERHWPRCMGMTYYREWSALFEELAEPPVFESAPCIGVLVVSRDPSVPVDETLACLGRQTGNLRVVVERVDDGWTDAVEHALGRLLEAGCGFIACVRAGDRLRDHALGKALEGFVSPNVAIVYTDSEAADLPWFKPAWNPEYALASDYPLELMLMRRAIAERAIGAGCAASDSAALRWQALAAVWDIADHAVVHVPRALYLFESALSEAEQAARAAAAAEALGRVEPAATLVTQPQPGVGFMPRRLQRLPQAADGPLKVSVIIPTRDGLALLSRCIDSLFAHAGTLDVELIVVDNGSVEAETLSYFEEIRARGVRVLPMPGPFNFSALNNQAVAEASGNILCLLNNDIEVLHEGWLEELVGQLMRPGVGAVGAKLLWPNGMVQHGGVVLGVGNVAGHYGNRLSDGDWGDHGRNQLLQQVSAVTAACLLVRKTDYLRVGGMDEVAFPVAFNDVDLCLKIRRLGMAIVWSPYARLLHAESASRGHEDTPQKRARAGREVDMLRRRWGDVLFRDPAYHPSLNLDVLSQVSAGLAIPPRSRLPRNGCLDLRQN
ncbi:MAG: glycosyltransferase family 2 protein [Proteobacteria bacterium]|nr:glycosyltransferase family 2 protein [Pseudomonadota bacterium]